MPDPAPVIIDTDPGVDDALALLFAGACPELRVLAVTTVAGNVGLAQATENARRILPVAWGGEALPPLHPGVPREAVTAEHVHGADGIGGAAALVREDGSPLYPPSAPLGMGDAPEAILRLATQHPGEVTLITLGPLTNLAEAIRRNPQGVRSLRRVVILGGAFREPGNTGPVSEFNVFADPEAAQTVCDSGLPTLWVPLDVTHRCVLRRETLAALPDTPRAGMARDVAEFYIRYHVGGYGEPACFLHDPLAVAVAIWPDLVRTEPLRVNVETEGRFTRGMTVADFRPPAYRSPAAPNADVCLEVDAPAFLQRFVERLAR